MLIGIQFKNFTILDDLTLGLAWDRLKELPNEKTAEQEPQLAALTCLIGRPSTGKSSVFKALDYLSLCLRHGIPEASRMVSEEGFSALKTRGSQEPMAFSLVFRRAKEGDWLNYRLALAPDDLGRPRLVEEAVYQGNYNAEGFQETPLLELIEGRGEVVSEHFGTSEVELVDRKLTALQVYGRMLQYKELGWLYLQITRWFVADEPQVLKRLSARQAGGAHRHLNPRFDNAQNVLDYFDEIEGGKKTTVERILKKIPDIKRTGDFRLDRGLESGNLKLFLYYLLFTDDRPLICLDEPERGLFYERVEELVEEMRLYLGRTQEQQIFLSSHSTVLLDCLQPKEVWLLQRGPEGVTAKALDDEALIKAFASEGLSLGSLWYSGHLDLV